MAVRIRRPANYIVALACIGWLVPLGFTSVMLYRYGYFYGAELLTGIPIGMIALTFILNGLPRHMKRKPTVNYILIGWTALTLVLGIWWLVIWLNRF